MQRPAHVALAFTAEDRLTATYLGIALMAVLLGVGTGFLQAREDAGVDLYPVVGGWQPLSQVGHAVP